MLSSYKRYNKYNLVYKWAPYLSERPIKTSEAYAQRYSLVLLFKFNTLVIVYYYLEASLLFTSLISTLYVRELYLISL
jgi:hypothetical protein